MSMNLADLYGAVSSSTATVQPTSIGGPNQGAVATMSETPPTVQGGNLGSGAAFSWVGLIILLVAWRVLIEMGARR